MATKHSVNVAKAVAQVATVQVTAFDASTTYKLTVNGVDIVSLLGVTDADGTAAALSSAWNLSTHPYATGITASVATDTVTLTADEAGLPFTVTSSVAGGTGTIGSVTTTTAATGPNHFDDADNWSDGAIPANGDIVTITRGAVFNFGLDQNAVDLAELNFELGASVGLNWRQFATTSNGGSPDTSVTEYRDHALKIGATVANIGVENGPDAVVASARIVWDNDKAGAATINVLKTTRGSPDAGAPAVRLLASNAGIDLFVKSAQASVGLGTDIPGETATFGDITVDDRSGVSKVYVGAGVTWSNFAQNGGDNILDAAADVTKVEVNGGDLLMKGDEWVVATLEINDGVVVDNHTDSASANTTVNLNGGELDGLKSGEARTWATVNHNGGKLKRDSAVVTISTYTPPTGQKQAVVSEV